MFLHVADTPQVLLVCFKKLFALRRQNVTPPLALKTYQTRLPDLIQTFRQKSIVEVGLIHYLSLLRTVYSDVQHVSYYVKLIPIPQPDSPQNDARANDDSNR